MNNPKLFIDKINTSQILVGLDFGDKTIGIAISDKTYTIATPIMTLFRKGLKKDIVELNMIFKKYNIGGVVIGLPLSLSGHENERTDKVRVFAKKIEEIIPNVTFQDERYSSDVIFKELRKNSISRNKIKKKINHLAASYILQGFLDTAKMQH